MKSGLIELYPDPGRRRDLRGTWLERRVQSLARPGAPVIYGSFVSSMDGRIALADPLTGATKLPEAIMSSHDFRLLKELMAQADCFITHGGYLRAIASGALDDILQTGLAPGSEDLARWRAQQGFEGQPGVIVASASLDFRVPRSVGEHGQHVTIVTVASAPAERVREFERQGYEVIVAGTGDHVAGAPIADLVAGLGYRSAYLIAGPRMLGAMLRDRRLARLFLTITHQILGGEHYTTLTSGTLLGPAGYLQLRSLYLDLELPAGAGQWFAEFEPTDSSTAPSAGSSCSDP
jgi:riboflavin biosynthesis pyrimidine reductase